MRIYKKDVCVSSGSRQPPLEYVVDVGLKIAAQVVVSCGIKKQQASAFLGLDTLGDFRLTALRVAEAVSVDRILGTRRHHGGQYYCNE